MTVINTKNAPAAIGPYVQGVNTGNMVITSGQLPVDPLTGMMSAAIEVQTFQSFNNQNKIIASVCVGALAVAKSGALQGRMGTTYNQSSKRQTQLSEMGVNVIQRPIVVDGNIITSQSPATAINVAFTLIEKLTSRANVEKIKEGMGFPLIVNAQN